MSEVTIRPVRTDSTAPLYLAYAGQHRAQGAFLELAEDGTVLMAVDTSVGPNHTPVDVFNGLDTRWPVSNLLTAGQANDLMDEARPLLGRVHAGRAIVLEGPRRKGVLDEDAREAAEAVGELCAATPGSVVVCTAEEWLYGAGTFESVAANVGLSHDTDDAALAALAAEWEDVAANDGVHLDGDVATVLGEVRGKLRDAMHEEASGPGI